MTRSAEIYHIYIAPEDILVYSVDDVFMDTTNYLHTYNLTARALAMMIIMDVLKTTGITATAGIGTNLYLSKVAMDIEAKHIPADKNGIRIAELDETAYWRSLWAHHLLTAFWRVGSGYRKKLEEHRLFTMGDIARCSLGKPTDYHNEALLYKLFGVNAELLIDHAWGWEPCGMKNVRSYKPTTNSPHLINEADIESCFGIVRPHHGQEPVGQACYHHGKSRCPGNLYPQREAF